MIAFLYAFLIGGLAAAIGGGSSGSSPAPAAGPAEEDPPASPPPPDEPEEEEPITPALPEEPSSGGGSGEGKPELPDGAYDIGWAGLSAEEQLIVELINRARLDPQSEVERLDEPLASGISSAPAEALAVVPTLSDAAEDHSEDMDNREFFSHTNPDGQGPGARALEAGHENSFVGENIGWYGSTGAPDVQTRAENHHQSLWESDGHQRNLMNDNWSEIGVGYDYGDHTIDGFTYDHSTFVTEKFGDTGETYLTGVVIDDADGDRFYDIGEGQGDVRITAWNDEGTHATATWDAGGYSLALPPGTYTVSFEGGDLDQPYETQVTIGDENVKLDVIEGDTGAVVASVSAATLPPQDDPASTLISDAIALAEETAVVEEETEDLVLM